MYKRSICIDIRFVHVNVYITFELSDDVSGVKYRVHCLFISAQVTSLCGRSLYDYSGLSNGVEATEETEKTGNFNEVGIR